MVQLLNRSVKLTPRFFTNLFQRAEMCWSGISPRPLFQQDGSATLRDADMASFLSIIASRKAVIQIPSYTPRTQKRKVEKEERMCSPFGKVLAVISNQDCFRFSLTTFDSSIVARDSKTGQEEVGAYRNYLTTDEEGNLYEGSKVIRFKPTEVENEALDRLGLIIDEDLAFSEFVHPGRWQAIFTPCHLYMKVLINRLPAEIKHVSSEIERLYKRGLRLGNPVIEIDREVTETGPTYPQKFAGLHVVFDHPSMTEAFATFPNTRRGLQDATAYRSLLRRSLRRIRYITRANELAYFKHGNAQNASGGNVASWMNGYTWNDLSFKETKRARKKWIAMSIGEHYRLRYRIFTKTVRIAG